MQYPEQEFRGKDKEMGLDCLAIEIGDVYKYMEFKHSFSTVIHRSDFYSIVTVLCRT